LLLKTGSNVSVQRRSVSPLSLLLLLTSFTGAGLPEKRVLTIESFPENPLSIEAIGNLQGEDQLQDLRIKLTNRSTKAIYYLNVEILFPNTAAAPKTNEYEFRALDKYAFPLWWGKAALVHNLQAQPDDASIRPGESLTLTVPELHWRRFKDYRAQKGIDESATRTAVLIVRVIGFGDGTGFSSGKAFPPWLYLDSDPMRKRG
jgi:hypothetical protein